MFMLAALSQMAGSRTARHRGPRGLPRARGPHEAQGGLDLKSAVVVVLQPRSSDHSQAVRNKRDLVLEKPAEQAQIAAAGHE